MIRQLSKTNFIRKAILICICLLAMKLKAEVFPIQPSQNANGQYEISTLAHLRWVSETTSAWGYDYILTSDIDATETSIWDNGNGLMPIGDYSNKFTGSFNGQNNTISNLHIDRQSKDYCGLFGVIDELSKVENIILNDCSIAGSDYVGGICGENYGIIINCHVNGNIEGIQIGTDGGTRIGGNLGSNRGHVTKSSADCITIGTSSVGGFVGNNEDNSDYIIAICYSKGDVSGTGSSIGGFVGSNRARINNCYSATQVYGAEWVGGFSGYDYGEITKCYATGDGSVTGEYWDQKYSGFNGYKLESTIPYKYCYYNNNGLGNAYGAKRLSSQEFSQEASFDAWEFDYPWKIATITEFDPDNALPYFAWQVPSHNISILAKDTEGNPVMDAAIVTEEGSVYAMSNINGDLEFKLPNGVYDLVIINDSYYKPIQITVMDAEVSQMVELIPMATESASYNGGSGTVEDPFQIDNLAQLRRLGSVRNDQIGKHYVLMSNIDAAETKYWNLDINDAFLGFEPIGSSANYYFYGSFDGQGFIIDNLFINRPDEDYVGLFGSARPLNGIEKCIQNLGITNAIVNGAENTGMLAGYVYSIDNGLINKCYAIGKVNGTNICGGLIGTGYKVTVNDCFTLGEVNTTWSNAKSGGLIGYFSESAVNNSYSAAMLVNDNATENFGGLVGYNYYGNTVAGCYRLSGQGSNSEGIGIPIEHFGIEARFSSWDFVDTWEIAQVPSLATGYYPYLKHLLSDRRLLSVSAEDVNGTDLTDNTTFTGEGYYLPGEQVVISATYNEGGYVFSWYDALAMVSDLSTYSFTMPDENLSLVAIRNEATSISNSSSADFSLYPNPANEYIILKTADAFGDYQICNANGMIVRAGTICNNVTRVNLDGCSSGVYIVNVGGLTKKFVIKY